MTEKSDEWIVKSGESKGRRFRFMKGIVLVILILFMGFSPCVSYAVDEQALFAHRPGIWEIAGKGGLRRWIVIHNLDEAKGTGIFHIEVIGREKGRPSWDIRRICNHMAVTQGALARSVLRPLKSGAVYPESFDDAYARWKKDAEAGNRVICDRSVLECLRNK
jgi:hypothetical protein